MQRMSTQCYSNLFSRFKHLSAKHIWKLSYTQIPYRIWKVRPQCSKLFYQSYKASASTGIKLFNKWKLRNDSFIFTLMPKLQFISINIDVLSVGSRIHVFCKIRTNNSSVYLRHSSLRGDNYLNNFMEVLFQNMFNHERISYSPG